MAEKGNQQQGVLPAYAGIIPPHGIAPTRSWARASACSARPRCGNIDSGSERTAIAVGDRAFILPLNYRHEITGAPRTRGDDPGQL